LFNKWLNFKHAILPQRCILCSASDATHGGMCARCSQEMPWHNQTPQCPQCAAPTNGGQLCGHCLSAPPAFDSVHALFRYEYPADRLLHRFKYQHMLAMAEMFASQIMTRLPRAALPDLIIPMPLHRDRLKERSFNQSTEIARIVASQLKLPMDYESCQRIRLTAPQASLPLKDRAKNIKGAFACQGSLAGMHVAVIDDVMTSGASLHELAKTLKKAGASRVECWIVARTLAD